MGGSCSPSFGVLEGARSLWDGGQTSIEGVSGTPLESSGQDLSFHRRGHGLDPLLGNWSRPRTLPGAAKKLK